MTKHKYLALFSTCHGTTHLTLGFAGRLIVILVLYNVDIRDGETAKDPSLNK